MSENVEEVKLNIEQPQFTINSVAVIADSCEPDIEISEEV
jgi:hypothetical protein